MVAGSSPALPINARGRAPPYDVLGSQPGREPDGTQTDSNCDTTESDAVQPTARGWLRLRADGSKKQAEKRGLFFTVSTIHKGGSMAHERSHSEVAAALKRLGQYRGILSSRQLKTIKGQIIAGDICGAEKGLRKLLPAIYIEGGIFHEVHSKVE